MKNFTNVQFKWTFRNYQQRVLDNSTKFLNDGKINIVAAPGSGKTILGLEMIRRLNSPCIIFSPTTTIREQWGERFKEAFLDESLDVNDYVSNDLNNIKLLTSITYQALHSAINKVSIDSEDEVLDYSNIDLFKLVNENKIKTICLDEAHHLQNEWQKALEKFIKGLDKNIKIIALTATPPYDATPAEWNRYISVCGEIDDEIFVPELVKEGTLCPHQDYVALNYPTQNELDAFKTHRLEALRGIKEVQELELLKIINDRINVMYKEDNEFIYGNFKSVIAIIVLLNDAGIEVNHRLFHRLSGSKNIPVLNYKIAQEALQFFIDDLTLINEVEKEEILKILKSHSLIHRKKVTLDLTDKLKRMLVSSCGKLHTISKIAEVEFNSLKNKLRMLVLTDYIKKESIANIGTDIEIDNISVVSIFEELRRNNSYIKLGCLSGTLVILPLSIKEILDKEYKRNYSVSVLENTDYGIYTFKGDNKEKVNVISKLFEEGYIEVLIGTASLLGEGWDSPCINSLILASYVGSFMLSNQMRGRAIRTYKKDPNKSANIWHLVTIEPDYIFNNDIGNVNKNLDTIKSADYDILSRRFECFVGPNYENGEIESGIERITFIKPPYNQAGIENINKNMFDTSVDRENLINIWRGNVDKNSKTVIENKIPKQLRVPPFILSNLLGILCLLFIEINIIVLFIRLVYLSNYSLLELAVLSLLGFYLLIKLCSMSSFIVRHISAIGSFKSLGKGILKAFKIMGVIDKKARLKVKDEEEYVRMWIENTCIREQNIFNTAIKELLTPIDNPRYIIIKKTAFGGYNYRYSLACPTLLATNNRTVDLLTRTFKKSLGEVDIKYAYSEEGKKLLVNCRKKSFIALNSIGVSKRQKVSND